MYFLEPKDFPSSQPSSSSTSDLPSSINPLPPRFLSSTHQNHSGQAKSSSNSSFSLTKSQFSPPKLSPKAEKFYAKYDSTEGVTTAIVLGGFFVFVYLLVVYKTKLKPMWRERQARKNNNASDPKTDLNSHNHLHKERPSSIICLLFSHICMYRFLKGLIIQCHLLPYTGTLQRLKALSIKQTQSIDGN